MNTEQLTTILNEYPMSRKLVVIVDGKPAWETTVIEVLLKLTSEPPSALTIFGRDACIVRERGEFTDDVCGATPYRDWLEIDLR